MKILQKIYKFVLLLSFLVLFFLPSFAFAAEGSFYGFVLNAFIGLFILFVVFVGILLYFIQRDRVALREDVKSDREKIVELMKEVKQAGDKIKEQKAGMEKERQTLRQEWNQEKEKSTSFLSDVRLAEEKIKEVKLSFEKDREQVGAFVQETQKRVEASMEEIKVISLKLEEFDGKIKDALSEFDIERRKFETLLEEAKNDLHRLTEESEGAIQTKFHQAMEKAKEYVSASTKEEVKVVTPKEIKVEVEKKTKSKAEVIAAVEEKSPALEVPKKEEAVKSLLQYLREIDIKIADMVVIPGNAPPPLRLALNSYNDGVTAYKTGDIDTAISKWEAGLRMERRLPEARLNLGIVLLQKGEIEQAISHLKDALRQKTDCVEAHNNLGVANGQKGNLEEEIYQYREALRFKPDYVIAHNNLGAALSEKGEFDEAVIEMKAALRLKPDYGYPHFNLGLVYWQQGKNKEAIESFESYLRYAPKAENTEQVLGWIKELR